MTMLPQPPPDAPAPPPSEAAVLSQKKWNWLLGVGISSIPILLLSGLTAPIAPHCGKKPNQTEAVINARQIGLALLEFEAEYGKFPDATTIANVKKMTGTALPLGTTSSNDYFRQLLASDVAQSEQIFHAKTPASHKPDNVFTGTNALEKAVCAFTYLLGGTTTGNPDRPLVVAPMIPGTDRFDPKPFEGKAVILRVDNSVTSLPIDKAGHVNIAGQNMMDPTNPIWDGHPPVIAWPE